MNEKDRRRAARRNLPGRLLPLDDEGKEGLIPPREALAMMWELATTAWLFSGREMPSYERSEIPGRLIRSEES